MTWTVEWGPVFRRVDFPALSMRAAERLCAAILQFAQTGRGPVIQLFQDDPRRLKVVVPGAVAYMFADERTGILHVGRAFRR